MKLSISTTRWENWLGYIYLGFCQLMLPTLIAIVALLLGYVISPSVLNILFFIINFIAVVAIFHRFLWRSLKTAVAHPWRCLRTAGLGILFYFGAMYLVSYFILWIDADFSNVNDQAIISISSQHTALITFCTVLLVPVVEETLYRGLFFQNLQRKNRILAYCVSCLVFAMIHIIGFIGIVDVPTLLLCFVQYLPAGIALAWAYEQSDTIVTPMLMHIAINLIGMSALR